MVIRGKVVGEVQRGEVLGQSSSSDDFTALQRINGIGEKTIEDIRYAYDTMEQLKADLQTGRVPLRNDVVEKLQEELL